ncbi:MAG: pantoate--beta-alanine ligase [Flavobacteriaceae bacterium]|nr:pantoate--beta-alanine ligase [Bacteroidia bacterium]NNL16728.1 pantoate--beta-alanine ligase [Flavobacteriaceae bacterium]
MKVFKRKNAVAKEIKALKAANKTIGLVPTMGALHEGHLSLVENGLANNDVVFISIFVNPTQFNNKSDLTKYPRTLQKDIDLLSDASNNIYVFAPSVEDVYDKNVNAIKFDFDGLENEMEGEFREGHFDGVGTIVKQLLEIVQPDNAYFGEKDFQQLQIIRKLVDKFHIPVNIVGCKIHREPSGLAMSSRNMRLSPDHMLAAPFIYKTLLSAKKKFGTKSANKVTEWVKKQFNGHKFLKLEYFKIADVKTLREVKRKSNKKKYRAFIAVYADEVRLIDNIALN